MKEIKQNTKRKYIITFSKFGNSLSFFDRFLSINTCRELEKVLLEIYFHKISWKRKIYHLLRLRFKTLHLNIKILDKKFPLVFLYIHKLFSFFIGRMPYLSSNVPSNMFYALIGSKILTVGRTNTNSNILGYYVKLSFQ